MHDDIVRLRQLLKRADEVIRLATKLSLESQTIQAQQRRLRLDSQLLSRAIRTEIKHRASLKTRPGRRIKRRRSLQA